MGLLAGGAGAKQLGAGLDPTVHDAEVIEDPGADRKS